jgi:hypothetical protein
MRHRPERDGRIVLAQRIHQVDLGPKSFMTEQWATWFENEARKTDVRLFDGNYEAVEDFTNRQ